MRKIKPSPFLRDIVLTTITFFITLLSVVLVTRLLAQGLGAVEFGAYALARRILTTAAPFSTFAMGGTLTRYLSVAKDERSKLKYLLSGFILGVTPSLIVLMIGLIFNDRITQLFFHDTVFKPLFAATLFAIVGSSFYAILYNFFRGSERIGTANIWQLGLIAAGPIPIALAYANSGRSDIVMFLMGALFFAALPPLVFYICKAVLLDRQVLKIKMQLKDLFSYSLPRVPAGFAFAGILSVGPFLAPYFGSLKEAGYFLIGQSMLSIVEYSVVGLGMVSLPKIARVFAEGKSKFLKDRIADMIAFVFHFGLFVELHLLLWADQIVWVWLGDLYTPAIPVMRILLLALIPYLAYVVLRVVLDATVEKAVNMYNLYLSFAVTVIVSSALAISGLGTIGLAFGFTAGCYTLGLLTIVYLWRAYRFGSDIFKMKECLSLNVFFIAVAYFIKGGLVDRFKGPGLLGLGILVELALFTVYFVWLWKLKVKWIGELKERVLFRGIS